MVALLAATLATAIADVPTRTAADHRNNAHAGYLYPPADQYEMNTRTVGAQSIPVRSITNDAVWNTALGSAVQNWNDAMSPWAGFSPFVLSNSTGFMSFTASSTQQCPIGDHGCILSWIPSTPSGTVFMWSSAFAPSSDRHRLSDTMHELGHVLYNAGQHYPTYNCTSIMGHSAIENAGAAGACGVGTGTNILIAVQNHDAIDYAIAYSVSDAQNAVYVQPGFGQLIHSFEGGYLGGNGQTVHQNMKT